MTHRLAYTIPEAAGAVLAGRWEGRMSQASLFFGALGDTRQQATQQEANGLFAPFARLRAWAHLGELDDLVAQLDRWEHAATTATRPWAAIADEIHHEANGWEPYATTVAYQLRDCEAALRVLAPRPELRLLRVTPTCTSYVGSAASREYAIRWADDCAAATGAAYVVCEDGAAIYTTPGAGPCGTV